METFKDTDTVSDHFNRMGDKKSASKIIGLVVVLSKKLSAKILVKFHQSCSISLPKKNLWEC